MVPTGRTQTYLCQCSFGQLTLAFAPPASRTQRDAVREVNASETLTSPQALREQREKRVALASELHALNIWSISKTFWGLRVGSDRSHGFSDVTDTCSKVTNGGQYLWLNKGGAAV